MSGSEQREEDLDMVVVGSPVSHLDLARQIAERLSGKKLMAVSANEEGVHVWEFEGGDALVVSGMVSLGRFAPPPEMQ